jgi:hypothetical protein
MSSAESGAVGRLQMPERALLAAHSQDGNRHQKALRVTPPLLVAPMCRSCSRTIYSGTSKALGSRYSMTTRLPSAPPWE